MSSSDPRTVAPTLDWTDEQGAAHSARWRSEAGLAPPRRVRCVDDTLSADTAFRLIHDQTALLWQGDYQNARQLLQALTRRLEKRRGAAAPAAPVFPQAFHQHRMALGQRARALAHLLIPLDADYRIPLRRAPDVQAACEAAWGPADGPAVVSLRELQGLVGAHEWRRRGVPVDALDGALIHPHYGVFSPVRGEYVRLVAEAPLPAAVRTSASAPAWDIGTGTGVLAAVLARRGLSVLAIDADARALACATENVERLGLRAAVTVQAGDLFPAGLAPLIVCNPPWLPGKPAAPIEAAIYDPDSRMLRGFLNGLAAHLMPGGEGWLILSDLAEHLGLRSREQLLGWIAAAGLTVLGRLEARPVHRKAQDRDDPLFAARSREVTALWRLGVVG